MEMATHARLALGEEVEVEHGAPVKRTGGSGTFEDVQAAQASLVTMVEWWARARGQAVLSRWTATWTARGRSSMRRSHETMQNVRIPFCARLLARSIYF